MIVKSEVGIRNSDFNMTSQELSTLLLLLSIAGITTGRSTNHLSSDAAASRRHRTHQGELRDDYAPTHYHPTVYLTDSGRHSGRGGPPVSSGLTQDQIDDIVDLHNELRRQEGASNMEQLTWNSALAHTAQKWSDRCNFEHGQESFDEQQVGHKQLGQNMWAHTDTTYTVKTGVQAWYDEKKDFYYDSLQCNAGQMCGHYTQLVWAKTKEVGCGWTNCSSISGMNFANFLVCNYGPAGNWGGEKPFLRGSPCSACSSGKFFCTDNLCDSSCNSQGSSSCICEADCGNCGQETDNCRCSCSPGWGGVNCKDQCRDNHRNCGANPGWPDSWCDAGHQFVLDDCPKLCKKCQSPDPGQPTCNQKKSEEIGASEDREEFQKELSDFVQKMQGHLHHGHAPAQKTTADVSVDSDSTANSEEEEDIIVGDLFGNDDRLAKILARVEKLRKKP
jgi:hypothetical protein